LFNNNGRFQSRYTFNYTNSTTRQNVKLTAELFSWEQKPDENISENTFRYQGRVIDEGDYQWFRVYVNCIPPPKGTYDTIPIIRLLEPEKLLSYEIDLNIRKNFDTSLFTHYTWGDVEGSVSFLNGCKKLLEDMTRPESVKYVSIGDVVGVPVFEKQGTTSDAETVEFANNAAIKIVGNRDLNKLRILPEYMYWSSIGMPHFKEKKELNGNTLPYIDEKKWLHDQTETHPKKGILTDFRLSQYL
jgi:hypothetical protein